MYFSQSDFTGQCVQMLLDQKEGVVDLFDTCLLLVYAFQMKRMQGPLIKNASTRN